MALELFFLFRQKVYMCILVDHLKHYFDINEPQRYKVVTSLFLFFDHCYCLLVSIVDIL